MFTKKLLFITACMFLSISHADEKSQTNMGLIAEEIETIKAPEISDTASIPKKEDPIKTVNISEAPEIPEQRKLSGTSKHATNYVYTVNPGDILDISVWNEDKLVRELRVLPDGSISFPLAGILNVEGKTLNEVQKELTEKLSEYIADPVVNVAVKAPEGHRIYVLGQVKQPGMYIMYQPMDVMQALTLAGGLTPFAEAENIVVLRKNDDISKAESIPFEYDDREDGEELDKNHLLENGDVIVVPTY